MPVPMVEVNKGVATLPGCLNECLVLAGIVSVRARQRRDRIHPGAAPSPLIDTTSSRTEPTWRSSA